MHQLMRTWPDDHVTRGPEERVGQVYAPTCYILAAATRGKARGRKKGQRRVVGSDVPQSSRSNSGSPVPDDKMISVSQSDLHSLE